MLTKEQAREKALAYIRRRPAAEVTELVIDDAHTREEDFGWVFFWAAKKYLDGDRQYALGGNGPIIVDRRTGELHQTGTARPVEHYIAVYRRDGNLKRPHG